MKALDGGQVDTLMTYAKGAAIGALLIAVGGQFWPGYMLDSNVKAVSDTAIESANNKAAAVLCQNIYMAQADSGAKLVALRATDSYRISNDAGVSAASDAAVKVFETEKILPAPSSYRVKNDCGEALHKSKPATAAEMKK